MTLDPCLPVSNGESASGNEDQKEKKKGSSPFCNSTCYIIKYIIITCLFVVPSVLKKNTIQKTYWH